MVASCFLSDFAGDKWQCLSSRPMIVSHTVSVSQLSAGTECCWCGWNRVSLVQGPSGWKNLISILLSLISTSVCFRKVLCLLSVTNELLLLTVAKRVLVAVGTCRCWHEPQPVAPAYSSLLPQAGGQFTGKASGLLRLQEAECVPTALCAPASTLLVASLRALLPTILGVPITLDL